MFLGIRDAAGGDQNLVGFNAQVTRLRRVEPDLRRSCWGPALDTRHIRCFVHRDAKFAEPRGYLFAHKRLEPFEQPIAAIENGHFPGAQRAERVREFASHGSASQHDESRRDTICPGGFPVGPGESFRQARNGRQHRSGSGTNGDGVARGEPGDGSIDAHHFHHAFTRQTALPA